MELVALKPRPKMINEESISILKDYLAMAESGELEDIAIAGLCKDGSSISQATTTDRKFQLLGAVSLLMHRLHQNYDGSK